MRMTFLAPIAAVLALGGPALAQPAPVDPAAREDPGRPQPDAPPRVEVVAGPLLKDRPDQLGPRELAYLENGLREAVEKEVARSGGLRPGDVLQLTIIDATPNRPTQREMQTKPGLSFQSFATGGAEIDGVLIGADGSQRPLHFRQFETDLERASTSWVWTDTERAFKTFARRLARGDL